MAEAGTGRKPVVIITGASRGIGLAVAKILVKDLGAIVVAIQRSISPELQELLKFHTARLLVIKADISNESETREAIKLALKTYQRIDGLILNAAVLEPIRRIDHPESTTSAWKHHFDINFFSLLYCVQEALPALRESKGRIVFVSSGAAVASTSSLAVYNASKAAMNSFCRTLSEEEPSIVAVAVRPGMVETIMQDLIRDHGSEHMAKKDLQKFVDAHEAGTLVKPQDTGYVIASLSLRAPKALSGQFVSWNGDECQEFRKP